MTTTTTVNETALDSRQVSLLQNHVSTTPDNTNTIYDCLESIQSKDFADLLQPVRSAVNDATQYKAAKSKLPAFMFNGVFQDGRGLSDLAHYNNLIVLDIDHIDNPDGIKNLLKVEPWIKAIFVSPSLKGLKIIVPFANNALVNDCNADLAGDNKQAAQTKLKEYHYNQFCDLESYFAKTYNLTLDKSGKDIPRLCYISYDANIYVNPDCVARPIVEPVPVVMVVDTNTNNNTATAYSEPKPVTTATNKRTKKAGTANEVPKCETWTVKQAAWHLQIVKADDYLTWRNVGFALSNHYNRSEEAFAAFVQWSKTSCKFISDIDCRFKIWDATNEATSKAITIATIAHYHNDACNDYYENIHLDLAARKHELYSSFVAKADTSYLTLLRDGYKTRGKAELKEDINHYLFSKGISPRSNEVETIIRNLYKVNGVFPTVSCLGAGIHSFNDEMYLVEHPKDPHPPQSIISFKETPAFADVLENANEALNNRNGVS